MRIFLDANIVIYLVEEPAGFGRRASAQIASLVAVTGEAFAVSDLVRLECRVGPLKSGNPALLADFDKFFAAPELAVIGLTGAVCDRAAAIRATFGFRTPDALNLAAAIEGGCDRFLTNDGRLNSFTGLRVESLL